ncbi:hypothetical protein DBR32_01010 [Taibaiella sp. KBW10]|uniref:hypothetical protein n=1 Tax=Taibaiella sp. KBW10 TaxID=2153357 RepID=UPI000F59DEA2|nr:hypothetical protein [Taibaiella sp. KBW10]RQO32222.1 hypothetical protein DBR32_01010 [Taibaiella sp. KBW10]
MAFQRIRLFLVIAATLLLSFKVSAQDKIWTKDNIEENERTLLRQYQKYSKKPGKEKLQKDFLASFQERVSFHQSVVDPIQKEVETEQKDWLSLINSLRSLQYIYQTTASVLSQNQITYHDYTQTLDSTESVALASLYARAQKALGSTSMPHRFSIAYRALTLVTSLSPGYKNSTAMLEQIKVQGIKTVYIRPVQMGNQGNYIQIQGKGNAPLGDYMNEQLVQATQNALGYTLVTSTAAKADYEIVCEWTSIDFGNSTFLRTSYERRATVNKQEVTATVHYTTETIPLSSRFKVSIIDTKNGNVMDNMNIASSDLVKHVTATYTGNGDALSYEDAQMVRASNSNAIMKVKTAQVQLLFDYQIKEQILTFLNRNVAW